MTDAELIARLRQVRRYRLVNEPGYQGQMLVRSDGKYVLHTDYVALLEQLAAARQDAKEAEAYAEELEAKLAKALEALLWCSGSADFNEGGVAREGWLKLCAPLLKGEIP